MTDATGKIWIVLTLKHGHPHYIRSQHPTPVWDSEILSVYGSREAKFFMEISNVNKLTTMG